MKIEKGRRVRIKFRLQVVDGDEIEKNIVEYFQGGGSMLAALEKQLEGLEKGAKKSGVLKAEDAFGNPAFRVEKPLKRSDFPKDLEIEPGAQFMGKHPDSGQDVVLRVKEIDGDDLTVEYLHPLADKDIEYDVEVLSVTDPTPPPLPPGAVGLEESD